MTFFSASKGQTILKRNTYGVINSSKKKKSLCIFSWENTQESNFEDILNCFLGLLIFNTYYKLSVLISTEINVNIETFLIAGLWSEIGQKLHKSLIIVHYGFYEAHFFLWFPHREITPLWTIFKSMKLSTVHSGW